VGLDRSLYVHTTNFNGHEKRSIEQGCSLVLLCSAFTKDVSISTVKYSTPTGKAAAQVSCIAAANTPGNQAALHLLAEPDIAI